MAGISPIESPLKSEHIVELKVCEGHDAERQDWFLIGVELDALIADILNVNKQPYAVVQFEMPNVSRWPAPVESGSIDSGRCPARLLKTKLRLFFPPYLLGQFWLPQ